MSETESGNEMIKEPSISVSIAIVINAAFTTYFSLRENPLPGWARFLFAWLGSVTIFVSVPMFGIGPPKLLALDNITDIIVIYVLAPSLFGGVIASAKTRHGPVRLFLFGIVMTSFIVSGAIRLWIR